MDNMLKDVLEAKSELLVRYGIKMSFRVPRYGSCGVDLDSSQYVGGITYWPERSLFEFQFNSCESGDVIILDTKEFHAKEGLAAFIEDLNAVRWIICMVDSPLGNPPQLRQTVIGIVRRLAVC